MSAQAQLAATGATRADFAFADALAKFDQFLARVVPAMERTFHGPGALMQLRGLHISGEEVRRALVDDPTWPCLGVEAEEIADILRSDAAFGRIAALHDLGTFELVTLLIALAPEFDLRYQRVLAYLQDDVTRRRPTVDLVLSLTCVDAAERQARRAALGPGGKLCKAGLIELVADPNYVCPPLLAQYVKPDGMLVRFLLGDTSLDPLLENACALHSLSATLASLHLSARMHAELRRVAARAAPIWLNGVAGTGKLRTAAALAGEAGAALLELDASRVALAEFGGVMRRAIRDAEMRGAWLYVSHAEILLAELHVLAKALQDARCRVILGGVMRMPAMLLGVAHEIDMPLPSIAEREDLWRAATAASGLQPEPAAIAILARRFRFTPAQIHGAVADAALGADGDLLKAARAQCGEALSAVATRIVPQATLSDIVLPDDALLQLREICDRVDGQERVFEGWGFARKHSRGRGTSVLFAGGSGTGKTMAAEVIANELGLELYRIDLARVVSKYIGETEKNLERVFAAAAGANAILLFDEADALFGKRSEVKDAHDRYANIEVAYLLQKMEEYVGVAILATNLADNLDAAFTRRLAFYIEFPFPEPASRQRLWERAWTAETPIEGVEFSLLAQQYQLSGGSIRNVAVAASYLAAADGGVVRMAHVSRALRREHQKLGMALAPDKQPQATDGRHGRIG